MDFTKNIKDADDGKFINVSSCQKLSDHWAEFCKLLQKQEGCNFYASQCRATRQSQKREMSSEEYANL